MKRYEKLELPDKLQVISYDIDAKIHQENPISSSKFGW